LIGHIAPRSALIARKSCFEYASGEDRRLPDKKVATDDTIKGYDVSKGQYIEVTS